MVYRPIPPTTEEKVIAQARKVLAMREANGLLPASIETTSALQELAILIQWNTFAEIADVVAGWFPE